MRRTNRIITAAAIALLFSAGASEAAGRNAPPFDAPALRAYCNSITVTTQNRDHAAAQIRALTQAERELCLYPLQHIRLKLSGGDDYDERIEKQIANAKQLFQKQMASTHTNAPSITLDATERGHHRRIPIIYTVNSNRSRTLYADPTMRIYDKSEALMREAIADWKAKNAASLRTHIKRKRLLPHCKG